MYRLLIATVLLAAVLAVLVLRRGSPVRTRSIKVTARTALHRGAYVAVVEIDGRRLLVGAGAQQVTLLTELDPTPPEAEAPADAPDAPSGVGEAAAPGADASAATLLERIRRATTRIPPGGRP